MCICGWRDDTLCFLVRLWVRGSLCPSVFSLYVLYHGPALFFFCVRSEIGSPIACFLSFCSGLAWAVPTPRCYRSYLHHPRASRSAAVAFIRILCFDRRLAGQVVSCDRHVYSLFFLLYSPGSFGPPPYMRFRKILKTLAVACAAV